MSSTYGAKIVTNGLLFGLDSYNNKVNYNTSNQLAIWPWRIGTGGETGFGPNGDGNSRKVDTTPFGNQDIVWDVSNQDAVSNDDGGWESSNFAVDPNYMYRFSVWVRRKTIGNGSFYLGLYGNPAALNRWDGGSNNNPYFCSSGWWGNVNEWYLVVGHVWPSGSGTGSRYVDSNTYKTNGDILFGTTDYVWVPGTTSAIHRSYLFYSTDTSTNQQWWQPRVDKMDGTQPSIKELLNGAGNNVDNLRKTQASLNEVYWTKEGYVFTPSRDNSSISIPLVNTLTKQSGTLEFLVKPDSYGLSDGLFVNRDVPTPNSLDWLWAGYWNSGSNFFYE
jgi:hypothetical protein